MEINYSLNAPSFHVLLFEALLDGTPSDKSEVTLYLSADSDFISYVSADVSLQLDTGVQLHQLSYGSSARRRADVDK